MDERVEDVIAFVGNVLQALLTDLMEQGADQERLERIVDTIENANTDIFDPIVKVRANLAVSMALAGALTTALRT